METTQSIVNKIKQYGLSEFSRINNTSDLEKPVSTLQQAALNLKANIGSPTLVGYIGGSEMTAPDAPAVNGFRIYAEDNGAGKTRLMVVFATGVAQQIAIEP